MRAWIAVAALLAVAGVAARSGAAGERQPVPLTGAPLAGPTHLRLLVASNPPFVLDVDHGTLTPLRSLAVRKHDVLSVVAVGGRDAAVIGGYPRSRISVVRGAGGESTFLGRGRDALPGGDGRSVWLRSADGCRLRRYALDGGALEEARGIPCHASIQPGGSLGLVISRTRVVDPVSGRVRRTVSYGILAVAGKRLVLAGPGRSLSLLNTVSGTTRQFHWPSIVSQRDDTSVDYQGRYVALAFADPAWQFGGRQALDIWALDTWTGVLTHVPGMPAFLSLKFTSMQWTRDGRLVLLAEVDERPRIAIWRPGDSMLQVAAVNLPRRTSGSDSFAILG